MLIASIVPATVKSISDNSASAIVGFIINSPLTRPTLTPAIGPSKGTSDIQVAKLEANIAGISGGESGSTDKTVLTT